ncbi:MAG: hypothetical protein U0625_05160 [Phycisphaerales bacterium]
MSTYDAARDDEGGATLATAPRTAVALLVSAVVHVAIAAGIVTMGVGAARALHREAAPVAVADWTPPPPSGVAPAPPELPVPGGAPVHAGPASRGRTDDATAAARAAERLATLAPATGTPARAPGARLAGPLGFDSAVPEPWRHESFAGERSRVLFLVDCGGRTLGTLPAARAVLAQRLNALRPDQEYSIVIARGEGISRAPGTPARASRASIEAALAWFAENAAPEGTADLGAALEATWDAVRPDAVCIISRGVAAVRRSAARAPGATLAETAERLNPADASGARRVSFLCIELGDPGPDGALRAVGERHGGAKGYLLLDRKAIGLGTPVPAAPGARAK